MDNVYKPLTTVLFSVTLVIGFQSFPIRDWSAVPTLEVGPALLLFVATLGYLITDWVYFYYRGTDRLTGLQLSIQIVTVLLLAQMFIAGKALAIVAWFLLAAGFCFVGALWAWVYATKSGSLKALCKGLALVVCALLYPTVEHWSAIAHPEWVAGATALSLMVPTNQRILLRLFRDQPLIP